MKTHTNQHGFAVLPILLLAVIIGLVGLIGWRVYDAQQSVKAPLSSTQAASVASKNAQTIAPITNSADIEKAQTTLDSAGVDNDLDASSLDQDLNDLL